MNITRQAATITHMALMLAPGVSKIGVGSAPKATPGRTSEAIAATGAAIKSLFFIDSLLAHRSLPGGRGLVMPSSYEWASGLSLDSWRKSRARDSADWKTVPANGPIGSADAVATSSDSLVRGRRRSGRG